MRAFDGGVPPKDNVTTVQVTVNRNLFCPVWKNDDNFVEILETSDVASPVFTVSASDDDTQVNKTSAFISPVRMPWIKEGVTFAV